MTPLPFHSNDNLFRILATTLVVLDELSELRTWATSHYCKPMTPGKMSYPLPQQSKLSEALRKWLIELNREMSQEFIHNDEKEANLSPE